MDALHHLQSLGHSAGGFGSDGSGPEKVRRRLPRQQREKLIVEEAIKFFAEVGFEGQTRALAQRLGVTQPLLYRYFPDKDALIERVYREVFLGGWDNDWRAALTDRSLPLIDRVERFYLSYTKANFSYERVRLFMFAGLKDESIANRYMSHVHENLFMPLCHEIRAAAGVERAADISPYEIELAAGLHGAIAYVGLRRWVYRTQTPDDMDLVIRQLVRSTMAGISDAFREIATR
jgi:AcrR family transcriptional regulator